jgi:hypothetical protein
LEIEGETDRRVIANRGLGVKSIIGQLHVVIVESTDEYTIKVHYCIDVHLMMIMLFIQYPAPAGDTGTQTSVLLSLLHLPHHPL